MSTISLSVFDLALAACLVLGLAALTWQARLGVARQLLIAGARTVVQLSLIGLVLKILFETLSLTLMATLVLVMLSVATYEVTARQSRGLTGVWGVAIGGLALFAASVLMTGLALGAIIRVDPWYTPQYLVPLLGMVLGNTMNGVAISLERLSTGAWQRRTEIEARLMLGHDWRAAIGGLRRDALRAGFIPVVNGMAAAGVVSLPGMMTGQILAGNPPLEATKYQILVMFLISSGTGVGALIAVNLAARALFDERQRLRLDRLRVTEETTSSDA